jgi:ABC-type lipoprotein release transport system permease subunit
MNKERALKVVPVLVGLIFLFIAVPVLLTLVALFALWIPARRAARLEPLAALRVE